MVDHPRRLFVSLAGVLAAFGLLMVYSASITSQPTTFERIYFSRHLVFLALGTAAAWCAANLRPEFWRRAAPWLFAASVLLLAAVLFPGVGTRVKGAQRWFRFGPVSFQPSELVKITLPLCTAWLMTRRPEGPRGGAASLWLVGPLVLVVPLVLLQPDLGTALFLVGGAMLTLFLGGWPLRNFAFGLILALPALSTAALIRPYQMRRIEGFLSAWRSLAEAPYQLQQSLYTLGAGGLGGVGLGRGWQKLSFLPESNTDFVFAVIGEELGLVGTLTVLALWAGLYGVGLRLIARTSPGRFERCAAATLLTQLVAQAYLNVAVVTGLVPPKGIAHPFISYGGSSLVTSLITLGIVLGLTRRATHPSESEPAREDEGEVLSGCAVGEFSARPHAIRPVVRTDPGLSQPLEQDDRELQRIGELLVRSRRMRRGRSGQAPGSGW